MNYFTLFELPVSLKVDQAVLMKKYYALSKQYHPDNFTLSNSDVQEEAEKMSASINEAKRILENPYRRLEYILKERNNIAEDEKYSLSPIFLGEMMDINEQLMELEFEDDLIIRKRLLNEVQEMESIYFNDVKRFFLQDELEINEQEALLLKEYYYKKKYLQRIAERLI